MSNVSMIDGHIDGVNFAWNVYKYDMNNNTIKTFNIFNHRSFHESVTKLLKDCITKEEFAEELKKELMYYFWSKCEYETVITPWPPHINKKELDRLNAESESGKEKYGRYPNRLGVNVTEGEKIDVYDQVMLNYNILVDYLWWGYKE